MLLNVRMFCNVYIVVSCVVIQQEVMFKLLEPRIWLHVDTQEDGHYVLINSHSLVLLQITI